LLQGLNLSAVFLTFVFCVCLQTLIPEQYKPYIDGFLLIVLTILSAGPFVINYLLLRKVPAEKQKTTFAGLFPLILLIIINLICLIFMYVDQFAASRGFALILCIPIYLFMFLPTWFIFLNKIKKHILSKQKNAI